MTNKDRIEEIKRNICGEYESIGRAYMADDQDSIDYHKMHLRAWQKSLTNLGDDDVEAFEMAEGDGTDYKRAFNLLLAYIRRTHQRDVTEAIQYAYEDSRYRADTLENVYAYAQGVMESQGAELPALECID